MIIGEYRTCVIISKRYYCKSNINCQLFLCKMGKKSQLADKYRVTFMNITYYSVTKIPKERKSLRMIENLEPLCINKHNGQNIKS